MKKTKKILFGFMFFVVITSLLAVALAIIIPQQFRDYSNNDKRPLQNGEGSNDKTASDWLVYENERFGYTIRYPRFYSVEDKTAEITGGDLSQIPWYFRDDFILGYIEFRDSNLEKKVAFTLETVNTTNRGTIMNIGNESIKSNGSKKLKDFDVYLYSIDSGINNMQVIFHNGRAYRFIHYLSEEEFEKIISTFEFVK